MEIYSSSFSYVSYKCMSFYEYVKSENRPKITPLSGVRINNMIFMLINGDSK